MHGENLKLVEKYGTARQVTEDNMVHAHFTLGT